MELLAQGVGGTADGLQLLKVSIQQLEMPLLDAMDRTTDASESDEVASLGLGGEAYLVFTLTLHFDAATPLIGDTGFGNAFVTAHAGFATTGYS